MHSVFITGIPTSGKTYLAQKMASRFGMIHVKVDDIIEEMIKDPLLKPWVNFFWDKEETHYLETTSYDEQWDHLVQQSEAFWPTIKKNIEDALAKGQPTIFEGVNLLPHLMQELSLQGIVLLGSTEEEMLKRLKEHPRWGNTEELQRRETKAFFGSDRPYYAAEAQRYGFPSFSDSHKAEEELVKMIMQEKKYYSFIEKNNV